MNSIKTRIAAARGEIQIDLLIKNARLVNVLSADIHDAIVGIHNGEVVGFGDYEAKEIIDLKGSYLCPGFIDGHIHLESTMLTPFEFSMAVVPLGTTSVVIDPHEIANVLGMEGIRYMLKASQGHPLNFYIMLPSCVPATDMETSGARLSGKDLVPFLKHKRVLGIAEMMNYPAVISGNRDAIEKIRIAGGKRIDGHAPLVSGRELNAYIAAGISSDHECTGFDEAREKLRKGMYIMIREGTTEKNLERLLPLVKGSNARRCMFVSDDKHPDDLLRYGHINHIVKKAVALGLDPVTAIQMVTINPAEYFRLERTGAIAPGYIADMVVLKDLKGFVPEKVFTRGRIAAEKGRVIKDTGQRTIKFRKTMNVKLKGLKVKASGKKMKVIEIIPGQIITKKKICRPKIQGGLVVADIERDILKIAVVERHYATGNTGIGFVKGFGLKRGALASSVSHDSHNIVVVGTNDDDMITAVQEIIQLGGGYVVVSDGVVLSSLQLGIAGLMSPLPVNKVSKRLSDTIENAKRLGCILQDPFMTMSFLALPVLPELKITDKGVVDVRQFKIVDLFEENGL